MGVLITSSQKFVFSEFYFIIDYKDCFRILRVSDTQTGYTAISLNALKSIRLYDIYKRYGMPNDMLVKLNMSYCTIREIPIKPVYRIGEESKMKIYKVIPKISYLLFKSFFKRIWIKYFIKDFHPLFILYNLSFILLINNTICC